MNDEFGLEDACCDGARANKHKPEPEPDSNSNGERQTTVWISWSADGPEGAVSVGECAAGAPGEQP